MSLAFLSSRPGSHDELGFVMAAIRRERRRWYPVLWSGPQWSRRDMMDTARGLAWFVLAAGEYQTLNELYRAVARELYREAKSWGWRREKAAPHFLPPLPTVSLDTDGVSWYYHS